MHMIEALLFSDDEIIFENTKEIMAGKYKLNWYTYKALQDKHYPFAHVVMMHFSKKMIKKCAFELIIQVKSKLGHNIPILTLIEEGSPQDIYSILETGVYDYINDFENKQEYRKKIEDIVLWNWYQTEYAIMRK